MITTVKFDIKGEFALKENDGIKKILEKIGRIQSLKREGKTYTIQINCNDEIDFRREFENLIPEIDNFVKFCTYCCKNCNNDFRPQCDSCSKIPMLDYHSVEIGVKGGNNATNRIYINEMKVGDAINEEVFYQINIFEPKVCKNGNLLYSIKLQDKTGEINCIYFAKASDDLRFLFEKKHNYVVISGKICVNKYNENKQIELSKIRIADEKEIDRSELVFINEDLKSNLLNGEYVKKRVVGISYYDFSKVSDRLMEGEIYLEREKNNPKDKNAIAVFFKDDYENESYMLGYIEAIDAKTFAKLMDQGYKIEAEYDDLLMKENTDKMGLLIKVRCINV